MKFKIAFPALAFVLKIVYKTKYIYNESVYTEWLTSAPSSHRLRRKINRIKAFFICSILKSISHPVYSVIINAHSESYVNTESYK